MIDVSGRPRRLVVKTELEDGGCARVTVRDSGVGLSRAGAQHARQQRALAEFPSRRGGRV